MSDTKDGGGGSLFLRFLEKVQVEILENLILRHVLQFSNYNVLTST